MNPSSMSQPNMLPPSLPARVPSWGEPPISSVGMGYPEQKAPPISPMRHISALYNPQAIEQMFAPPVPSHQPEVQIHISVNQQQPMPQSSKPAQYLVPPLETTKHQKKIYFPLNTGINYIGLLIGPKGMYQKKLEEQTSCKILIRGKYLYSY